MKLNHNALSDQSMPLGRCWHKAPSQVEEIRSTMPKYLINFLHNQSVFSRPLEPVKVLQQNGYIFGPFNDSIESSFVGHCFAKRNFGANFIESKNRTKTEQFYKLLEMSKNANELLTNIKTVISSCFCSQLDSPERVTDHTTLATSRSNCSNVAASTCSE